MSRHILFALLLATVPVMAGDIVTRSFTEGLTGGERVLRHVEHKAVVAEYLDPMDTGIGKSMAYLLWREVLSAISDQSGAGVILARPPGDERLVDLLEKDYHAAALRIAEHQEARLALWGAAQELGEQVYITSYLSLVEATRGNAIRYSIQRSPVFGTREGEIEFTLPRNKLNFPTVRHSRERLFRRPLMLTRATNVRAEPSPESQRINQLPQGAVAQGIDMSGGWFKIELPNGKRGYITATNVDLAPLSVRVNRRSINLRIDPVVREDTVLRNTNLRGEFAVLEQRFSGNRLWYRIDIDGEPAWLAASLGERVYSMSVVHFVAGLYRYFGARHEDTIRAFQGFIDYPGSKHNNVNLSVAYQYQALSNLLTGTGPASSVALLRKARAQTPLDATTYKIEALSWIGDPDAGERVSESLRRAREMDPKITELKEFERSLEKAVQPPLEFEGVN
jgi:hypothetical protein